MLLFGQFTPIRGARGSFPCLGSYTQLPEKRFDIPHHLAYVRSSLPHEIMKVFLDIDIGDAAIHAEEVAIFTLTSAFYEKAGPQVSTEPSRNAARMWKSNLRYSSNFPGLVWVFRTFGTSRRREQGCAEGGLSRRSHMVHEGKHVSSFDRSGFLN